MRGVGRLSASAAGAGSDFSIVHMDWILQLGTTVSGSSGTTPMSIAKLTTCSLSPNWATNCSSKLQNVVHLINASVMFPYFSTCTWCSHYFAMLWFRFSAVRDIRAFLSSTAELLTGYHTRIFSGNWGACRPRNHFYDVQTAYGLTVRTMTVNDGGELHVMSALNIYTSFPKPMFARNLSTFTLKLFEVPNISIFRWSANKRRQNIHGTPH